MPSTLYTYENPEVINTNILLKHFLKKKYDWVIDLNLVFVTVRESRTDRDYNEIVLDGVIKVDEDWYENQWREYNYSFPIPDPNDDRDVVLGELLGGESAMKFNSECRKAITLSLKRQIQGLFWSGLVVRTEEVKKEDMTESIRRILREETEEQSKGPYVVFVSGIESAMSHKGQTSLFEQSYNGSYPTKSFNFKNKSTIQSFIDNNSVRAIVLFSKACELADELNFPSNKIYCIEPWNGVKSDAGRDYIYTNIPAQNMYIDDKSYSRGKGTKKGANATNHADGHFKALTDSVSKIRF